MDIEMDRSRLLEEVDEEEKNEDDLSVNLTREEEEMLGKLPPMLASIGKGVFKIHNGMEYIQAENFLINNLRTLRIA